MNLLQRWWAVLVIPGAILGACAGRAYLEEPEVQARAGDAEKGAEMDMDEAGDFAEVEKGLYIGGRVPEPPPGTDAVLCLCEEQDVYRRKVKTWNYQPIVDGPPAPSLEWLEKQVQFVAQERKADQQVYVHCWAGVSRAAMVTTAYLMWEHRWTRDVALDFLHEQRPIVSPNLYFMDLLSDWEDALKTGPAPAPAK